MAQKIEYESNPQLNFVKADFKGNVVIDGIYCNHANKDKAPVGSVIRWKLSRNPQKKEKQEDAFQLSVAEDMTFLTDKQNDIAIWLGHSFFYLRINDIAYVTDPIISDLPTSKRKVSMPYEIASLGKIDYVLISHAHFDHFDIPTLKTVAACNPNVEILGPLGMSRLLKNKDFKSIRFQEAGWYQTFATDSATNITFLPAKHWYRRRLTDFNKVLWGGFALQTKKLKIYFAGDTAADSIFFHNINDVFGGFDVCFIPIGAYKPEFLMHDEHANPHEALDIFKILHGNKFIPMHYGTYDMSDEPMGEPIRLLMQYAETDSVASRIVIPAVGEVVSLDSIIK